MYKGFQATKVLCLIAIMFTLSACIDLEPDSAVNVLGQLHTVTATITEPGEDDEPITGALLTFRVISGPNEGLESVPFTGECVPDDCITNELGQVSWTYTSEVVGLDTIVAFSTFSSEEGEEITVGSTPAIKIWEGVPRPIPTISQWGLIAMASILGTVGFIFLRRKVAA